MGEGIGERFQRETKYSQTTMGRPSLDWSAKPEVYKTFASRVRLALPPPRSGGGPALWDTISARRSSRTYRPTSLPLADLSQILWAAQGVTRRIPGHELRAAPSAGALYPVETYLAVHAAEEAETGIYHYDVQAHVLELLKAGDFREAVAQAALFQDFTEAARDLVQEKLHSYPLTRPLPEDPAEPLFVNTNDTINRNSTASAIVFEGAPSPDKAHLATMWVILGQPSAGVAVPVWPAAGKVPAPTAGPGTAPLCDFARALVAYLYPDRRGHMPQYLSVSRLRTYGGEGVPAKLLRVENEVIARTVAILAEWEKKRPAAADMAEFQESAAVFAYEALKREFPDIR
ncbi:MAG TPA: SagB/ThcOx family dehydrogenase [Candidatus Latescibacteria bacterium]|nr:SagB/ThcOx family dehydrogenase [Candidatus Latescibacterota bacterium]